MKTTHFHLPIQVTMRILLVEDEEKVSRFIVRGLEAERLAVDAVGDGVSGLDLAATYSYDLVILDLMMPGMSGRSSSSPTQL
jgi:DNA-binding response OmpR family regulator